MAKVYKCFVASPSDTNYEREICDKVFLEINKAIGQAYDFRIESIKWENDTRPSFGSDSQSVINKQVGDEYDFFIGIMYKKFGTSTTVAGSGTEEEFNRAYERYSKNVPVEIMWYFNDEPPKNLSDVIPTELEKVKAFQDKVASLGGLYCRYMGIDDFESKLRSHLNKLFIEKYRLDKKLNSVRIDVLSQIYKNRLNEALSMFSTQPIIWVDRILSSSSEISQGIDESLDTKVEITELTTTPSSTIIKAPPQFGLTSLSHFMALEALKKGKFWIYLDSKKIKPHNIYNAVKNEATALGESIESVDCIILDSWSLYETGALKKLKVLSDSYKEIPVIVMQTIDDSNFVTQDDEDPVNVDRDFQTLHLLALPRTRIRKVVSEYNKVKPIADEDILLSKVISDLESLNIHRTPQNCLTLLKVSERYFDESPVNRTQMLEMVLFVLFNLETLPTYKGKPDLKDCEYVLGRFCEGLIRNSVYSFTREQFISQLEKFCSDKLIALEVDIVFDVLNANNIVIKQDFNFIFRSSFWIFYFAAKRMHSDKSFTDYIFESKKYISFPELIEFYTGIDRNRVNALEILKNDLSETYNAVFNDVGLPDDFNPLIHADWKPTEEMVQKMQNEIGEGVLNSRLPDEVKDQFADKNYDPVKPYNQNIQSIFQQFSLYTLMQKVRASSRALRNSDYVDPVLKKEMLREILKSWQQISKVLFALTPILAAKGNAQFDGTSFYLDGEFGETYEQKLKRIMIVVPYNIVSLFKDDLFSAKIGPLLFDSFKEEKDPLIKHCLALFLIRERPREWKKHIEDYIVSLAKNSFFLYDVVASLRIIYKYAFVNHTSLKEIEYLLKMGLAKHHFGDRKPGLDKIRKISNENLPKRELDDLDTTERPN